MIADDDQFLGMFASGDSSGDGPNRTNQIIRLHSQSDPCRTWPGAVGKWKTALPRFWHERAAEGFENRPRVFVRQWRADDAGERCRARTIDARCAGGGCPPGRERIPGDHEVVNDAAALDVAWRPPGSVRIHLPLPFAIVCRIDDHNLMRLKGVGPKLAEVLNANGVYHFHQIAAWGPDEIAWIESNIEGFSGRVVRDDWVGQSKVLAAGGETEHSQRVDRGEST